MVYWMLVLLTAFDLQRACLCVQRKAAQVHIAHRSDCDPEEKETKLTAFHGGPSAWSGLVWFSLV